MLHALRSPRPPKYRRNGPAAALTGPASTTICLPCIVRSRMPRPPRLRKCVTGRVLFTAAVELTPFPSPMRCCRRPVRAGRGTVASRTRKALDVEAVFLAGKIDESLMKRFLRRIWRKLAARGRQGHAGVAKPPPSSCSLTRQHTAARTAAQPHIDICVVLSVQPYVAMRATDPKPSVTEGKSFDIRFTPVLALAGD